MKLFWFQSAESRLRIFAFLTCVSGCKAAVSCFGPVKVSGSFEGCDSKLDSFLFHDLQTPIGTYPRAIVRGSDIISIDFR
mmetsp:Transcript_66181/g.177230  ORF Transcript_66181/g.177230 Transcript_66181/m.177230 type:complete len:80 (+) Transcript_66181:130-369(+)